ncbi:hypothetical protein A5782_20180 [Mycobacterium sp. 852002-40037_SCH5390672]|nr:hypothetical protein [Mycobacterium sp. 852002-40037_SCH5390672]OBC01369.1 hypothetical protein A5782_20180 [Mycobacterium sp. 852002-40037_SCH5390672]
MDGSTGVWILGSQPGDFAPNLTKEGRDFAALTAEIVDAARRTDRRRTPGRGLRPAHRHHGFVVTRTEGA